MTTETQSLPRVIIELQVDGSLMVESYVNGMRSKLPLNFGFEAFEIREALAHIKRQRAEYAKQQIEKAEAAAKARHGQVWRYVAEGHGIGFANRTVNGVSSLKRNAKVNTNISGEKKKPISAEIKDMLDLL